MGASPAVFADVLSRAAAQLARERAAPAGTMYRLEQD
jgi:hypothetical protein